MRTMNSPLTPLELISLLDRAAASKELGRNVKRKSGPVIFKGPGPLPKGGLHHAMNEFDINCSEYFRAFGRELQNVKCVVGREWMATRRANQIAEQVEAMSRHSATGWQSVSRDDVQQLANAGGIVVGFYHNPAGSGHVAIAFPIIGGAKATQKPPIVRDGNEHLYGTHLYAGSWGAIGYEKAFGSHTEHVKWYLYRPDRTGR